MVELAPKANGEPVTEDTDERTPFTDGSVQDASSEDRKEKEEGGFCTRLKEDRTYRRNYFLTLNLISSFFVLGWAVGQAGPAFLDLQIITDVNIDRGSAFFTSGTVGYLFGSLVAGYLFDKLENRVLMIFLSVMGIGVTTAAIPWLFMYELMVFVQILKGIAGGVLDTSGNALLSRTWGSNGRMFMQALHFGFAFGGAVSPLAIAPFLIPEVDPENVKNSSVLTTMPSVNTSQFNYAVTMPSMDYASLSTNIVTTHNLTSANSTGGVPEERESILYIGFSISAAIAILCAIPSFVIFLQTRADNRKSKKVKELEKDAEKEEEKQPENMTKNMKIVVVIVLLFIFVAYCAVEDSFMAFLSTFCVRQLKWTKVNGALITSAFWAAFAVGRLAGIVLVILFSPVTLIFFHATLELMALAGIFVSSWFEFHIGMWISAPILGFAMSVIFPSVFTWTEESFLPVTGRISSLFLVGATAGSSINPLILGQIMDKYSNMWFVYLLSGEAVLLFIILIVAYILSKNIVKPNQVFQEIKIEIRSERGEEEDDHRSIIAEQDINFGNGIV